MSNPYQAPEVNDLPEPRVEMRPPKKSWPWVVVCLSIAAASVVYRLIVLGRVEQTALMFIGLPLVLAIALSLTPRPSTVTGVVMKGIALALLLFGILLFEGFICILMAAPLFFLVGFIVGKLVDRSRGRRKNWQDDRFSCTVLGVMLIMSFEGVSDWLSFDRDERVVVNEVVEMSAMEMRSRLSLGPDFVSDELPVFLSMGFPQPVSIDGGGVNVGDRWTIHLAGGEGEPGDLVVEVVRNNADGIRLECIKDSSHISHWMNWKSVEWFFEDCGEGQCKIRMVMEYERLLDPAWYFKPIERYGVKKAGEYFISQMTRPTP